MKTYRLDITHRAQFPAENEWAADRICRTIEEAQTVAAARAISEIRLTTYHRALSEFDGSFGKQVPLRHGGDGDPPTARETLRIWKSNAGQTTALALGLGGMYYGIEQSTAVGFGAGAAIWSFWLVGQLASEVLKRLPRSDWMLGKVRTVDLTPMFIGWDKATATREGDVANVTLTRTKDEIVQVVTTRLDINKIYQALEDLRALGPQTRPKS